MKKANLIGLLLLTACGGCSAVTGKVVVTSPDGKVTAAVDVDGSGRLVYSVGFGSTVVIKPSPMGVTVDGKDLGDGVRIGEPKTDTIDETYPTRGWHTRARNHCNVATIPITHVAGGAQLSLVLRAYNDGVAYRYVVPGEGKRTVGGEASAWKLPDDATVWYHSNTKNYEAEHKHRTAESFKPGTIIAPPMMFKLPGNAGYAALTEGALYDYSGMTLRSAGESKFLGVFEDDESWELAGTIESPWRIVMISPDLNCLVNSDIITNVSPPPAPELADADWIRPGRALWSWWSEGTGDWTLQKRYADAAAKMGFEYILVDAGWRKWKSGNQDAWALLKEVVDYARAKGVDVWVWKRWNGVAHPKARNDFFAKAKSLGVVGVKVDFMDSESKERLDFYEACLRDAAKHKLMINFHGANKPTGEARTWPNEMTREGIKGLEYNKWAVVSAEHNATLPLTRFLAGHGDYTPCTFDPKRLKRTTWTHQIATTIVFTSPVMHWADNPKRYLANPALDLIKTIPPVWDETRVLAISGVGEIAAFARRTDKTWFLGILNGGGKRTVKVPLGFLGDGEYAASLVRDVARKWAGLSREAKTVRKGDTLSAAMNEGGGFVGCFIPK